MYPPLQVLHSVLKYCIQVGQLEAHVDCVSCHFLFCRVTITITPKATVDYKHEVMFTKCTCSSNSLDDKSPFLPDSKGEKRGRQTLSVSLPSRNAG